MYSLDYTLHLFGLLTDNFGTSLCYNLVTISQSMFTFYFCINPCLSMKIILVDPKLVRTFFGDFFYHNYGVPP